VTLLRTFATGLRAMVRRVSSVDARGFSYKRVSDILFEKGFRHAPLQDIGRNDPQGCSYLLICRALARGQGKIEGLHERHI
jgi:CRISPR system Cascade subunit CasA